MFIVLSSFRIPFFAPPPEKEVKDAPKPLLVSLPGSAATADSSIDATATAGPSSASAEESSAGDAFYETTDTVDSIRGEKRVKGVDQPIRKIVVTNKFLPDDQRRYEDEVDEVDEAEKGEPAEADESDQEGVFEEVQPESDEEEELGWDDVVAAGPARSNAKGKGRAVGVVGPTGAVVSDDEDEGSDARKSSLALFEGFEDV